VRDARAVRLREEPSNSPLSAVFRSDPTLRRPLRRPIASVGRRYGATIIANSGLDPLRPSQLFHLSPISWKYSGAPGPQPRIAKHLGGWERPLARPALLDAGSRKERSSYSSPRVGGTYGGLSEVAEACGHGLLTVGYRVRRFDDVSSADTRIPIRDRGGDPEGSRSSELQGLQR